MGIDPMVTLGNTTLPALNFLVLPSSVHVLSLQTIEDAFLHGASRPGFSSQLATDC